MLERSFILFAVSAGLVVTAAHASAETLSKADESRRICRGGERQFGSHIRATRRCRTAAQWRIEDEEKAQLPASLQVTQGQSDGTPSRQPQ